MTQLEMTKKVQDNIQKNVQSLLDQALGEGRAVARVSVELDFDDTTTDTQTFTPVVDDSGIIRSQQDSNETYTGTATNPGGPAGVQSNVPGYVAQNGTSNANYEKKESTKNYEINEEKKKVIASPGAIKRLNVAVLVNDDVNATQQDSIMRSVSSAAGINQDRGDTISVEPLPFSTEARDRLAAEQQAEKDRADRIFYAEVAGAILLLALIIGGILMYRRKKRQEREAAEEAARLEAEEQQRLAEERAPKPSRTARLRRMAKWQSKNSRKRRRSASPKSSRSWNSSTRSQPKWRCSSRPGLRRTNKWQICMAWRKKNSQTSRRPPCSSSRWGRSIPPSSSSTWMTTRSSA